MKTVSDKTKSHASLACVMRSKRRCKIIGYIKDPATGKRLKLTEMTYKKGDSLDPSITLNLRWLRKYLLAYKKNFSGHLRREWGFRGHCLKLGIYCA